MLQRTDNRVYLAKGYGQTKESFAAEAARAKYKFKGKEQTLKFDGKVDAVVLDSLKGARGLLTAAADLSGLVDSVESQKEAMDDGKPVSLKMGAGKAWSGEKVKSRAAAKSSFEYVYTSPDGHQKAIFTDDGRAKLRTYGEGITHEVIGKVYNNSDKDDLVYYLSESVGVKASKGSKSAKKASEAPAPDAQVPF